jgi:hypothetical protein
VKIMEGLVFGAEFLNSTIAVAGLLVLLAVAMGAILFSYVADEEAKGRRIEWLEEPLAMPGEPERVEAPSLRRAA